MKQGKAEISKVLNGIKIDFGGGCSLHKALIMAYLIKEFNMKITCDIGIYRGRSFFPQAIAHKIYTGGLVYGIDPFKNELAREYDNELLKNQLEEFFTSVDFERIYIVVEKIREDQKLKSNSTIIRLQSKEAFFKIQAEGIIFDMIHIDGNHDMKFVMQDLELYSKILNENGIIILDDISWDSVRTVYSLLKKNMYKIYELIDKDNDFAVFATKKKLGLKAKLYFLNKFNVL